MTLDELAEEAKAALDNELHFDVHGDDLKTLIQTLEPGIDVIGPAAPLPSHLEAINLHVRQIEIICDTYNLDPYQYLADLGVTRIPCRICNGTKLAAADGEGKP